MDEFYSSLSRIVFLQGERSLEVREFIPSYGVMKKPLKIYKFSGTFVCLNKLNTDN